LRFIVHAAITNAVKPSTNHVINHALDGALRRVETSAAMRAVAPSTFRHSPAQP
jgi:hypothetical protein